MGQLGLLTNAVMSWHFPLKEWHNHTSPLKSYVSSIKARTPFCKLSMKMTHKIMVRKFSETSHVIN